MGHEFIKDNEVYFYRQTVSNSTVALQSSVFDMTGFEGAIALSGRGTTAAESSGGLSALTGTASASGGLSQTTGIVNLTKTGIYMEQYRPGKQFLQFSFLVTGTGQVDVQEITVIRYGARAVPTTQPASTTGTIYYTPGSGTATG